ncbi:MAG: Smr/MutS family protein [Bacteroidales bacterium]|nr:Smr/MutS family protein [Bacteroidales bacterium]
MIYPVNFESKIEFDKIRDKLSEYCNSELGAEKVRQMSFLTDFAAVDHQVSLTEEFRQIHLFEESFPDDFYYNCIPYFKKIRLEGTFLSEAEVFNLKRSLETIKNIIRYIKNLEEEKYPVIKKEAQEVKYFPMVAEKIDSVINKFGKIKDNASPELNKIRKDIQQKHASVSKKIQQILKHARDSGLVDQDAEVTLRDGRPVIPVSSSDKRKIKGIIHDESASGKTSFIEPAEIVELNNEIRELEYAERREIIKILIRLADDIRPYSDELITSYGFLGTIDFMRAKAQFAVSIEAIRPKLFPSTSFRWIKAQHPLLYLTHKEENKEIVPLDIQLNKEARILLISGPNAGGKSVCLKTVGLVQYMLQCGMLVPMSENSETGMFENIFIDIGDEQSLENDLSTYSSHLISMKFFARHATEKTMVLIDEFGTGTEPVIGGAIAEAILDKLNKNGTFGVLTTHYTNLKHFAASADGIVNGAMLFDTHKIQPLFKLEMGKPGSSFAIDIARKIGLPEDILQVASEKAGKDYVKFDKHLREILRDKRYWEEKRGKIRHTEKRLDEVLDSYAGELESVKQLRKEILEDARIEARKILEDANKEFEKTIREIRESQADKEKTKQAREAFNRFRETTLDAPVSEDDKITRKMNKLKDQEGRLRVKRKEKPEADPGKKPAPESREIRIGDHVKLIGRETTGEVLEIHGNNITLGLGNMVTTVKTSKVERLGDTESKRLTKQAKSRPESVYSISERKMSFKPAIDIRGKRADEAIELIRTFIDEAIMVNSGEVRILHGKGNGILRQVIRDYLHTLDVIKTYKDEHVEQGGAGITVVTFDF